MPTPVPLLINNVTGISSMLGFSNVYNVDSVSGDNANNGNSTGAWKTLAYAATQVQPGDTVVLNGVFNAQIPLQTSGTATDPITWLGNHRTLLHGEGLPQDTSGVNGSNISYNRFYGLELTNFSGNGINLIGDCVGNVIEENYIHHIRLSGIWIQGCQAQLSLSYLRNNLITDIGLSCISLWFNYVGHYVLDNNTCRRWDGAIANTLSTNFDGIHMNDTPYVHIVNNKLYDGDLLGTGDYIDLGGNQNILDPHYTHHVTAENNLTAQQLNSGNNSTRNKFNNHPKYIIGRYNECYGLGFSFYEQPHVDCSLYNNTISHALTHPLQFWNANETSGYGGFAIKRNIFAFGGSGLQHWPDSIDGTPTSMLLENNGYIPLSAWDWVLASGQNSYSVQNSIAEYQRWRAETGQEPADTGVRDTSTAAQTFADHANHDFNLVPGHAFIGAGLPLTFASNSGANSKSLFVDYDGYFHDTYHGMIDADTITINGNANLIESIDDATGEIILTDSMTWAANAPIDLARNTNNNLGAR